ncbi:40S ribosomal protein mrp2, mitochondrial [Fusarium solani]|nr:40S ribosomal protein mrp2, mitochondrial [Fusarium solani]
MSMFRAKKLDLGCFVNIRTLRDHTKRKVFEQHETERQALRYIIRNTTLPPRVRAEAQLQLTQMHCYTRPTQIRNRCIMGGQGRGVLSDFKMTRVRAEPRPRRQTLRLTLAVQLSNGGHGWQHSWCEESQLVENWSAGIEYRGGEQCMIMCWHRGSLGLGKTTSQPATGAGRDMTVQYHLTLIGIPASPT